MDGFVLFSEGSLVGKVAEFKTESEFLKAAQEEYPDTYDCQTPGDVLRTYCRYFHKPPMELSSDFPDGCYALYAIGGRGAFEVFVLES